MNSKNFDDISPPTSRLKNIISLACSVTACVLFIVYVTVFLLIDISLAENALNAFTYIFFAELVLIVAAVVLAVSELIRNPFPSSIISIVLSAVSLICTVIFFITAAHNYGFVMFSM